METRSRDSLTANGRSILLDLRNKQDSFKRDSIEWIQIQREIDVIVAQNYLHYHVGKGETVQCIKQ